MEKIWNLIFCDGLVIQVAFILAALTFFVLGSIILLFVPFNSFDFASLKNTLIFTFLLLIAFLSFVLSFVWIGVGFAHPNSKWAKFGIKNAPDSGEVIFLPIVFLYIVFAFSLALILRFFGVRGYPIKGYRMLYED